MCFGNRKKQADGIRFNHNMLDNADDFVPML